MQELFNNLIKIVERAKGAREIVEAEMKEYYRINKETIDSATARVRERVEKMMQNLPKPTDFFSMIEKSFNLMKELVGEKNFEKMMKLQEKYPFLQEVASHFIPQQSAPKKSKAQKTETDEKVK